MIKLIYREQDYCNFIAGWIRPLAEERFQLVPWDPTARYGPGHAVLSTFQQDFDARAWFRPLEQQGLPVIIDHLWDSDAATQHRYLGHKLELRSGNWVWYEMSLRATSDGYHQYRPNRQLTHDFLMLMNKQREHRDRIAEKLSVELETARWSYVDRGRLIGDDNERATPVFWEFYMNPQWYDTTRFSVVVESWMRSDPWFLSPTFPNYKTEVSEKVYKPLAWFHPFVVVGSVDTLSFLRQQGFETFDNLWDESYDTVAGDWARFDAAVSLIKTVVREHNRHSAPFDAVTDEKLAHNHHRFFDMTRVQQGIRNEILDPIEEFLS